LFDGSQFSLRGNNLLGIDLAASISSNNGLEISGTRVFDSLGSSVSNAGDVNNDGIDDLIVGAPRSVNALAGQSYVIFGSSEGLPTNFQVSNLNGNNGFVLNGTEVRDRTGGSVSGIGDINNDGIDDLIVGSTGKSHVVFGSSKPFPNNIELSTLNGGNGFTLVGGSSNSNTKVSDAGDVNDDGIDDLIVRAGELSHVVFGASDRFPANLELSDLDGNNGFTIKGIDFISSASGAGDINGDGISDLIVGSPSVDGEGEGNDPSQSYVIFGSSAGFPSSIEVSALNGRDGFTLNAINIGDQIGVSVSDAGDINGDGIDDLIIGSLASPNGKNQAGQSYVVFGSLEPFPATFELTDLNGSNGFILNGIDPSGLAGSSVSGAGDINDDGVDDFVIGAPRQNFNGQSFLVFGSLEQFPRVLELADLDGSNGFAITGINRGDRFGNSVSGAGDINNDGIDDLIVGAPGANDTGQSFVLFGRQDIVSAPNLPTL
ncbi:MAG: integrin alpha, partial [Cyanobacteria bacterium P01_E01_bin.34]